jgi:hypothetical protein
MVLIALWAGATLLSNFIGLSQIASDAVIYTVVVFGVVIAALRPAWGRRAFWRNVLFIFVLHVIGITFLVQLLAKRSAPGVMMIIAGMIEGVLIGSVLWRRTVQAK